MVDLSDWVWLAVAAVWLIARVLPRLFRSRASKAARPEPAVPSRAPVPDDRKDSFGQDPIEPR